MGMGEENSDSEESFYNQSQLNQEPVVKNQAQRVDNKRSVYRKKGKRIKKKQKVIKKIHNEKQNRLLEMGEERATKMIKEMQIRYTQDLKAYQSKRAAVKKLNYVQSLSRDLKNIYICEKFLEYNGLTMFQKWLGKLSDGFEPSLTLRKNLFEILLFLKVRGQHIVQAQELQKIIHKHKRSQVKELRDLSEAIMLKWGQITYEEINE